MELANVAFNKKNYTVAKENYQKVLETNSKDPYAQTQLAKCNSFLNPSITLSVSREKLSFASSGGKETINVRTNSSSYSVTAWPSWYSVTKYSNYLIVTCKPHTGNSTRSDWFKVTAGNKEIRIYISQPGTASSKTNTVKTASNSSYNSKCFNCPYTKDHWGISIGYINKIWDYAYLTDNYTSTDLDGIQIGIHFEPLFKYGFGIDVGLYYEYYSQSVKQTYNYKHNTNYEEYAINIPIHLEYRFNLSKYFNSFIYGGIGFDAILKSSLHDNVKWRTAMEYGGGLRIDHVQINIGQSLYLNEQENSRYPSGKKYDKYKYFALSVSYMF
jgi:hypothetical protein